MASLFIAHVPEYEPIWTTAVGDGELEVHHTGPYVELRFDKAVTIDRVATGTRHALWYSCVGAVKDAKVVQFDKDVLRVEATSAS